MLAAATASSFVWLILVFIVLGIAYHFLEPHIAEPFKKMTIILIILCFIVILLNLIGIISIF
jgi:hypothetical protein